MKRIFAWLGTKLSRSQAPNLADTSGAVETATPDEVDLGIDLPKEIRDLVNDESIPDDDLPKDSQESAMKAPMPDIYADEDVVATVPDLKMLDLDTSPGFDPYDTAKTHKK